MERAKRISGQTLAVAILTLLLVASLVMTFTGAWFLSQDTDSDAGYTFGTITLGDIAATFDYTLDETSGDVIMPGDQIDVDFDIINSGTADMWVRFSLEINGTFNEATFTTPMAAPLAGWSDGGDGYYYRDAALIGDLNGAANQSEHISYTFEIPTTIGEVAEGQTISFALTVDAVQVANNGTVNDAVGNGGNVDYTN